MASFHEVQFPTNLSYQSRGGPGFNTQIAVGDGGSEERVARWESGKHQYDLRYAIKTREDLYAVKQFHYARKGAFYGFRFKDWVDYNSSGSGHQVPEGSGDNTTSLDQSLGGGDSSTHVFQLVKQYTSGPTTVTRNITKPVAGTVKVALNGATQVSGWSVDTTTGLVTFTAAPGIGVSVTAGFEFDVPVRFGDAADKVLMASIDDYGYGSLDPVPLIEDPDNLAVNDDAYSGGAAEICLTANWQLSAGYCRGYVFEPQSSGLIVKLPDPTSLPTGGPFFYLFNAGPYSIAVQTFGGAAFITLASGTGAVIVLTVDGANAKVWYAV